MELPHFPRFRQLKLEDKEWYERFCIKFEPYADFSFGNFIIWMNQRNDLEFSQLNDNLIFRFSDNFSVEPKDNQIYTLLGNTDLEKTISQIFSYQQENGLKTVLGMLPRVVADGVSKNQSFKITEDRDNSEYVLDAVSIAHLKGSKLRSLREDCNSFMRRHGEEVVLRKLDLTDEQSVNLMKKSLNSWSRGYANGDRLTFDEVEAINRIFRFAKDLDYRSLCIYIEDKLEGFILYRYLPQEGWVLPNIIKLNYDYKDIFDFAVFAFANEVVKHQIKYINFEQDLGLPGLRHYKNSLKPVSFLNKYSISPIAATALS